MNLMLTLFAKHNPIEVNDKAILIKVTSNYSLVLKSEGKGWTIEFGDTRTHMGNAKGDKIGSFNTLLKTREILTKCINSKQYAISMAMRYSNPLQVVGKVIDPLGDQIRGVNAVTTSEYVELQKQGYSFVSSAKGEAQSYKVKRKIQEFIR